MDAIGKTRRAFVQQLLALAAASTAGLVHWSRVFAQAAGVGLEKIAGQIVHRGDASYPSWWASMTWYVFKPKRYPEVIVRAASEADVIETINHARQNGHRISVRSSGHNPAKSVLREGGILLDLSQLHGVELDAKTQTAWIQPGIRANELAQTTTRQGLVFPAAHTGMVGLGGYLLGGGLGWNMRENGIACRSIVGAEIITAEGKKVMASAEENPDLFWAIRGAGPGFFGAVVRYKLRLYPVHQAIEVSTYVIPVERLAEALAEFEKIGEASGKRLEILIKVGRFHPTEKPYVERELVCVAQFFAFAHTGEDAQELMQPVAASRLAELSILKRENIPITYPQLYVPPETDHSSPGRTAVENMWTDEPAQAFRLLADKMIAEPPRSPRSFFLCGWSFNSTFEDPSVCIRTGGRHYMSWYMIAEKEDDIEPNYAWMDEAVAMLRPLARGHYINEIDPVRYPQHVEECFSPESWEKLQQLRRQYDPQNVFHAYLGGDDPGPGT